MFHLRRTFKNRYMILSAAAVLLFAAVSAPTFAQEAMSEAMPTETAEASADESADAAAALDSGDTAWMLTSSALVMLMLPGLALFYAGMVRRKNVLSSMIHSFAALGVIGALWAIVGYSIAFGSSVGGFFGNPLDKLFLLGVSHEALADGGAYPELIFMIFQGMFAIITPALISGAIAERVKFSAYIWFIALWSLLVYCPLAHWVWGGGWLMSLDKAPLFGLDAPPLDFAGGTVVHLSSGISALIIVLIIGTRRGWPSGEMLPHNMTMTLLGAGLLWFGWFGFNAGSALAANADRGPRLHDDADCRRVRRSWLAHHRAHPHRQSVRSWGGVRHRRRTRRHHARRRFC